MNLGEQVAYDIKNLDEFLNSLNAIAGMLRNAGNYNLSDYLLRAQGVILKLKYDNYKEE